MKLFSCVSARPEPKWAITTEKHKNQVQMQLRVVAL